jgi:hypothetical protein
MDIRLKSILFFLALALVVQLQAQSSVNDQNAPFQVGEKLELKISYGWFTIGKATADILKDTLVNNTPSYHIKVVGKTAGLLGFFSNTEDSFEAIIDKETFRPIVASQNFLENAKRDIQTNTFDYEQEEVIVEKINFEKNIIHDPKIYKLEKDAFDILSSYLYLRSIDYRSFSKEDSTMVRMFFGKKHWDFGIEYDGTEIIKTIFGKINTHRFYVLFPVSSTFPNPKSVIVWTTQDQNQLPLKVKAKLRFGQVVCELTNAANLIAPIEPSP